jgi:hypothetical protein
MTFRYARHTVDLQKIEKFYTEIVGLEKLGGFQDHDGYDGLFLGHSGLGWHLEFTVSAKKPKCSFDEDDILVFYLYSEMELALVKSIIANNAVPIEIPVNPYWVHNGIMVSDPDGYKIVFSFKSWELTSTDSLTTMVKDKSIHTWSEIVEHVKRLPYGRNQNREDLSLVLQEGKGTCSSKHALLKKIADLNNIETVKLILGMYKMNQSTTPKIQTTISEAGLDYIPEAHCYLMLGNRRFDITTANANMDHLKNDILEEMEIQPEQVARFKVDFHKAYIRRWIDEHGIDKSFDDVWDLREKCIEKLAE